MDKYRRMERQTKKSRKHSAWRRITALAMSGAVVSSLCGMALPADTQKQPGSVLDCQFHVHQHTDTCYDEEHNLICGQADYVVHVHDENCYGSDGSLVCTLPEIEPHTHREACYQKSETDVLICPLEESAGHIHDESCYKEVRGDLFCPLESDHVHTEDCYTWVRMLTCLEEEGEYHTHDESCYMEEPVLTCDAAGSHQHTDDCYTWVLEPVCGKTEGEGAHYHSSECYQKTATLVCGELELHTHTEECRDENGKLICGKVELLEHAHGEECFGNGTEESQAKTEESEAGENETAPGETGESTAEEGTAGESGTEESETGESGTEESETWESAAGESGTGESETGESETGESGTGESAAGKSGTEESETRESAAGESGTGEDEAGESEIVEENGTGESETEEGEAEEGETDGSETEESETEVSNPDADVETAADWEQTLAGVTLTGNWADDVIAVAQTQLGYQESARNFVQDEEGDRSGYTRYGAWYGDPYGEWCAMFVSFCLSYAGVENFPPEENCERWIETLSGAAYGYYRTAGDYMPQKGDLIFFDRDADAEADHVGLVAEVAEDAETGAVQLVTIEGDVDGCVQYAEYDGPADEGILGYAGLPQRQPEETVLTWQGDDYSVQVCFTEEAQIPENAVLDVREVLNEEYEQSCGQAKEALGVEELEFARFFDISFLVDGAEVEPSAPVDVKITYDKWVGLEEDQIQGAVHFTEEGTTEVLNTEAVQNPDGTTVFCFTQDSFSIVGVTVGQAMAREAGIPGAPAVGPVEGTQVNSLENGAWYIIYDYADDYNKGFVLKSDDPNATDNAQLTEASMIGGPVIYNGTADVVWQYVQLSSEIGAFRNRNGQYLRLEEGRYSDGSVDLYNGKMYLSSAPPETPEEGIKYRWIEKMLYTGGWGKVKSNEENNIWNYVFFNNWNGRGCRSAIGDYPLPVVRYDKPTCLAKVTGSSAPEPSTPVHPHGAVTGNISDAGLTFFNVDGSGGGIQILAGVEYTIYKQDGTKYATCTSGSSSYMVSVGTLPDGTYSIEQTGVPEDQGYVVVPQRKSFTVSGGNAVIGVFYDYKEANGYESDKTAEVVDYINRTYKVDLSARSGKYAYELEDQNFQLIVDQSNSMLFPALLTPTGNEVTLYGDGFVSKKATDIHNGKEVSVTGTNSEHLEKAGLSHNKLYYIIADPNSSSTVYAIWYDNVSGYWLYQDASYYAKASGDAGEDNNTNDGKTVQFPTHEGAYADGGGSLEKRLGGMLWGDCRDAKKNPASKRFVIYEGSHFNRLHYLQESMLILINQLAALNSENTVSLITFDKDVYVSDTDKTFTCAESRLSNDGVQTLMGKVNSIKTSGGTRQDLALDHAREDGHIKPGKNTIILISDGAPVASGDVNKDQLKPLAEAAVKNVKKQEGCTNTLITIGLSTANVTLGHTILEAAASSSNGKTESGIWFFEPDDASTLSSILMENIFSGLTTRAEDDTASNIKDVISDSFYPINPEDNAPLTEGTYIRPDGHVMTAEEAGNVKEKGQLHYDQQKHEWYVEWLNQTLPCASGQRWHGTVYLKAKEDFIGGNVIDTNKSASIVLETDSIVQKGITLETPTVNVRLLDMPQFTAESTVFLGDMICREDSGAGGSGDGIPAVMDVMKEFYQRSAFEKLVAGEENTYNKYGKGEADGCKSDVFTLSYAIGRALTDAEWQTLRDGGTLNLPYTYDAGDLAAGGSYDGSSHGPVGYFTISLSQKQNGTAVSAGTCDNYAADTVGKNVLQSYLNVTYTAYKVGEDGRPAENKHNGAAGPGYNVGRNDATELEDGKGVIEREHEYDVHVIDGRITVQKKLEQAAEKNSEFKFKLTWLGLEEPEISENPEVQEATGDTDSQDTVPYGRITVKAGQTEGTDTEAHLAGQDGSQNEIVVRSQDGVLSFPHLKRGYYRVEEIEADDDYETKSATVITEGGYATNCPSEKDGSFAVIFHIGYHQAADGTTGATVDADNIVFETTQTGNHTVYSRPWEELPPSQTDPAEKEYHKESHGAVEFLNGLKLETVNIPVEKKWVDHVESPENPDQHTGDTVYVVLCDKDGNPVMTDSKAQVLKLASSTSWKGEFAVTVPQGTTLEYTVRELTGVSQTAGAGRIAAVVVNETDEKVKNVYFDRDAAAGDQDGIELNGRGYVVSYGETPEGGLTVTNSETYWLPATGGTGTLPYTISGLLLIGAALMYYITRRRKEAMMFR